MSCLDDAKYTFKVVVKKFSFLEDVAAKAITEDDWNNYQGNSEIEAFTVRCPMDMRVYELKKCLCENGYIPNRRNVYNQTKLYMSEGFDKQFKEIQEGNGTKYNNSYCELYTIVPSPTDTILLVVVNDYERKWDDDDDCDEPYPGWQSLINTTDI